MNKRNIIQHILKALEAQLELSKEASEEAAEYATHEEAKADSKWDTQGLEASYLAAGQAAQVAEIGKALQAFRGYLEASEGKCFRVESGTLFSLSVGIMKNWFFLASLGGGVAVEVEGIAVTVITPSSPIAHRVVGRTAGESVYMPNGSEGLIGEVF